MEYIIAEQFLKQSKEVQKVFLDWWEPKKYDLVTDYKEGSKIILINPFLVRKFEIEDNEAFIYGFNSQYTCYEKDKIIPLLSEGQLRQFIEDKLGTKIDITFSGIYSKGNVYEIEKCVYDTGNTKFKNYNAIETDSLLEAYWEVACMIAKEELTHE